MFEYFVAFLAILVTWLWLKSRPSGLPPGPLTLPIIGNLYNVSADRRFSFFMDKLHQKYGPIISLSLIGRGKWDVWFQGYDLMKEVLHDPRFTARSSISLFEQMGFHKGIGFASGEDAKSKRRMTIQVLKILGVGKSAFSMGIEEEIERLLKYVEDLGDTDVYIQGHIACATSNIISRLLFDTSYEFDDPEFMKIHESIQRQTLLANPNQLMFMLPNFINKFVPKAKELLTLRKEFIEYILQQYQRRKPSDGETREAECVADFLWDSFGKDSESGPFPREHIPYVLSDLFVAGHETTTTTLSWAILNLLHKPEVQEKVYEELLNEFPERDQIISLNDILSCNYLMATIHETQRFTPVLFSSIDHTANVDVENLRGYKIPKGTRMFPQFYLLNRDPKIWKYANEFNPKNFLDEKGVFVKNQNLTPFSIGLRACPGENIAKMEMYLVFANLFRRFKICPPKSGKVPPLDDPQVGFVVSNPFFEVRLVKRQN